MSKWEDLEQVVALLLTEDGAKRTPLSGATKMEEDVVGRTIMAQCKQTEHKNISILKKDLDRLEAACHLQEKFPLFFNDSSDARTLSIPISDKTIDVVHNIINMIIAFKMVDKLEKEFPHFSTYLDFNTGYKSLKSAYLKMQTVHDKFMKLRDKLETKIDTKMTSIQMYDLFEGAENGTQ
jgi:hypothetical protein